MPHRPGRRVLIISDTHLGHPQPSSLCADQLAPLLEDITDLVVNGDAAELQYRHMRVRAAREVERLETLCEDAGVQLTLVSGNHDAFVTDIRYLSLAGGQVFVTHGDAFHPGVAPWSAGAPAMIADFKVARASLKPQDLYDLDTHLGIMQHVSHRDFIRQHEKGCIEKTNLRSGPRVLWNVVRYWRQVPDLAAQFVERFTPDARVVVFGHSHHQGVWRRRGRLIINTGSYAFPGKPWAVRVDGPSLTVHRVVRGRDGYRVHRRVLLEHALAPRT